MRSMTTLVFTMALVCVFGWLPESAIADSADYDSHNGTNSVELSTGIIDTLTTQYVGDSKDSAIPIPLNEAYKDRLLSNTDENWYRFTLPDDGAVELTFDAPKRSFDIASWRIRLANASDSAIWNGYYVGSDGQGSSLVVVGLPAGEYYIRVERDYTHNWSSAQYAISVNFSASDEWETEPNDQLESADSLIINRARQGSLASDCSIFGFGVALDCYSISIPDDGVFELVFDSPKRDNDELGWNVVLSDSENVELWQGWFMCSKSQGTSLVTTGLPAGEYYIRVQSRHPRWTDTRFTENDAQYTIKGYFTASNEWETEPNNDRAFADDIDLNRTYQGNLKASNDRDYYKFTLTEDEQIELVFDSLRRDDISLGWEVRLEDADGSVALEEWFDCDASQKTSLGILDLPHGDYYLRVSDGLYGSRWTDAPYSIACLTKSGNGRYAMHRLYNPWTGEHFYTASESERDDVIAAGWDYEGEGWTAPETGNPVYRIYNSYAGEHHYSLSADERDTLVAAGWTDEGVGWYSDPAETTPLYREYNPNMLSCNHNYTTSKEEHDSLVELGWHDEGVAWYGV